MQTLRHRDTWLHVVAAGCLLVGAGAVLCSGQESPQVNRRLKILYAGHSGSDREKDFVSFLKKHFDVVQTGNLQTFQESDTPGFDVTLLDWDWNEFKGPRPRLSESFSRPLMTLGVPGGLLCSQWRLKAGYL